MPDETIHQLMIELTEIKTRLQQMPTIQDMHELSTKFSQEMHVVQNRVSNLESAFASAKGTLKWIAGIVATVLAGLTLALVLRMFGP